MPQAYVSILAVLQWPGTILWFALLTKTYARKPLNYVGLPSNCVQMCLVYIGNNLQEPILCKPNFQCTCGLRFDWSTAHVEAEFGGNQNKSSSSFQQNSGYKEAGKFYLTCLSPVIGQN